jgi:hypothetical protein
MAALPDSFSILMHRAARARADGALELATATYREALELSPYSPVALRSLIDLAGQRDFDLLERVMVALKHHPDRSDAAAVLHYAAAKAYDDFDDVAAAWRHLVQANDIDRQAITYDVRTDLRTMSELAAAPAARTFPHHDGRKPIFIVGLPRSGSTLIERILSAHPHVRAGGELPLLPNLMRSLTPWRPSCPKPAWGEVSIPELRAQYLASYNRSGACWTDKQLLNFAFLPWALAAFPGSVAIHARREPLATIYGIYRQRFQRGTWPFAYSLSDLADFYVGYHQLMSVWNDRLGARVVPVDHKTLCTQFEPTVHELLRRLALPMSSNCLNFKDNPAPVETMSAPQVRQRITLSTRWERYIDRLAPAAERLKRAGIL